MSIHTNVGVQLGAPFLAPSASTLPINGTFTQVGLCFLSEVNLTLNSVRVYFSAVTGSLSSSDISCAVYSSSTVGLPDTQIGSSVNLTSPTVGWNDFSGLSISLTAGTSYWIVINNANGSPNSNNVTLRYLSSGAPGLIVATNKIDGSIAFKLSGTWTAGSATAFGYRLGFSDGSFAGIPCDTTTATRSVYGTRETGAVFTSPSNCKINVSGLYFSTVAKIGTPTGDMVGKLYTGSTPSLLATSFSIISTAFTTTSSVIFKFSSSQTINPSTVVRFTLAETTNSDSSSNTYTNSSYLWDSSSDSIFLLPMNGTFANTYYDGSSWTDYNTVINGIYCASAALILDPNQPFSSSGGGGAFAGMHGGFVGA